MEFRAAVLGAVGAPLDDRARRDGAARAGRRAGAHPRERPLPHRSRGDRGHRSPIRCRSCSATRAPASSRRSAPAVTAVTPGDHVVCSWNPHCGHCFYCERDQPILCEPFTREQPRGHLLDGTHAAATLRRRSALHHFSVVSSHAEYCGGAGIGRDHGAERDPVRPRLPDRLRRDDRRRRGQRGWRTVEAGAHGRGDRLRRGRAQCAAGRAGSRGPAAIIAIDATAAKLARRARFGATRRVDGRRDDVVDCGASAHRRPRRRLRLRGGRQRRRRSALALETVRPGGQLVWLGKINVEPGRWPSAGAR